MRPWSLFTGALELISATALPASGRLGSAFSSTFMPIASLGFLPGLISGKAPASAVRVCSRAGVEADDSPMPGVAPAACPTVDLSFKLALEEAGVIVASEGFSDFRGGGGFPLGPPPA